MAITAVIALSSATCTAQQAVAATCTVTNSGTGSVNVLSVVPTTVPHSGTAQSVAVAQGVAPTGPGMTVAVAGSNGTLALTWSVVPHAPSSGYGLGEPASYVYDVGATIYTSDGAITAATIATLTVSSPSHT